MQSSCMAEPAMVAATMAGVAAAGARWRARTARVQRWRTAATRSGVRAAAVAAQEVVEKPDLDGMELDGSEAPALLPCGDFLRFHHVQFFVESLRPLAEYKALEARLNAFSQAELSAASVEELQAAWAAEGELGDAEEYSPLRRDLVRQLLHSAGWRITATSPAVAAPFTESLLLSSPDPAGVRFIITALRQGQSSMGSSEPFDHFAAHHPSRFLQRKGSRGGVGVLAFEVASGQGVLRALLRRYRERHPKLLPLGPSGEEVAFRKHVDGTQILDVYAYYEPAPSLREGGIASGGPGTMATGSEVAEPDRGTLLRFIEYPEGAEPALLPGLEPVEAEFPGDAKKCKAYTDHWVSNVVDRVGFLATLEETLGFTPKVDFNAGVVAAGEAVIESTVTGNRPAAAAYAAFDMVTERSSPGALLKNQQQVYLPINNALSDVGHVHLYVEQLGQGVQHLANRVPNLVSFVERCNRYREVTGEGLSFLRIPRSYYGRLTPEDLCVVAPGLGAAGAAAVVTRLQVAGLSDLQGVVALDATWEALERAVVGEGVPKELVADVVRAVGRSRYKNLHAFLKDRLSEKEYLGIVRNKVLVDVQGQDVLFQIFTAPVLQRAGDEEAPFLEFIQRRCDLSSGPARPGCGGFGIRNFLTLFLSIEVSKAMDAKEAAHTAGDIAGEARAAAMVDVFTSQLDASNPILTEIADAMTAEADALDRAASADSGARSEAIAAAERSASLKEAAQRRLQAVSEEHRARAALLRTGGSA